MIPLHNFLLYCLLYTVAIATPGPGVISIVARALGQGFRKTVPACLGITAGDLILMTLSAYGLALVAKAMGGMFEIVKIGGGLYLLFLSYKYWTANVSQQSEVIPESASRGFLTQMGITLSNPKAIAFFVALQPTAIDLKSLTFVGYLELVGATLVLIPAITMGYAALAARLKSLVASVKARRRINKGAGLVMAGAGIAIMVK
ncbi:MAG TPA: LysE family translocator [Rhizomicrobium sp.]|nr:LysE family translocator [Rhizomicrobium sp.]